MNHPVLYLALLRLATLQREAVDRLALQEAVQAALGAASPQKMLAVVIDHLQLRAPVWKHSPEASDVPALVALAGGGWGILRARNAVGNWVGEWWNEETNAWVEAERSIGSGDRIATLRLLPPYRLSESPVLQLVRDEISRHKSILFEAAAGGVMLAFIGILISFYSMQIYNRVVPVGAYQTLLVLTLGVCGAIFLEYAGKILRSHLYERLIDRVDQRLARAVYLRFLSVRLDQLPKSVGSLAAQLRGYETVRNFLVGLTGHVLVDMPFAIVFLLVIAAIGKWIAVVPLVFLLLAIVIGLWQAGQIRQLMRLGTEAGNLKTGLLVESVEGAEIIKSGQSGWRMLGRWLALTDESRGIDLQIRHLNEAAQYRAATMQQLSYVLMVAWGAWLAGHAQLTIGELIACSILSGRVLAPVVQLSMQLTNWASVKAALVGLDAIWKLQDDHHGQSQPTHLEKISGAYRFEKVVMELQGRPVVDIQQLEIKPGEKIGIIGPIGAGKTTLLRLLSGMFKPSQGRIWLDDVDLAHLSKPILAENVGYLPQDGRLLAGTLRENLILGLMDPGDDKIIEFAKKTGLHDAVIAPHPLGLQQEIAEGGTGLSGGQRQLVNLTRVFLRRPKIWLLDEPTAAIDTQAEQNLVAMFRQTLQPADTVIVVTHKAEILSLMDRLVVMVAGRPVLDGPRDVVIAQLKGRAMQAVGGSR